MVRANCLKRRGLGEQLKKRIPKGHHETFRVIKYVHYLEGDDGFMSVYICQIKLQT